MRNTLYQYLLITLHTTNPLQFCNLIKFLNNLLKLFDFGKLEKTELKIRTTQVQSHKRLIVWNQGM